MSDVKSLDAKSRLLDERLKASKLAPIVGFRLDLIEKLIKHLRENQQLKQYLGDEVTSSLALVWDEQSGEVLLADAKNNIKGDGEIRFLRLLREVIDETLGEQDAG